MYNLVMLSIFGPSITPPSPRALVAASPFVDEIVGSKPMSVTTAQEICKDLGCDKTVVVLPYGESFRIKPLRKDFPVHGDEIAVFGLNSSNRKVIVIPFRNGISAEGISSDSQNKDLVLLKDGDKPALSASIQGGNIVLYHNKDSRVIHPKLFSEEMIIFGDPSREGIIKLHAKPVGKAERKTA